jgi:thiamine-phosphate pyrophosphorylase
MRVPRLLLITDGCCDDQSKLYQLLSACRSGIPGIQLREKQMEARRLWEFSKQLRETTARNGVFFSINERTDIALAVGADGVHLPESGISPSIPKKLRPSLMVGVSVHHIDRALQAEQEGADYVLFGPLFNTPSKKAYGPPQGLEILEKIACSVSIPVLAVGGITPRDVKRCLAAGAYGVSAISAFSHQEIDQVILAFQRELDDET